MHRGLSFFCFCFFVFFWGGRGVLVVFNNVRIKCVDKKRRVPSSMIVRDREDQFFSRFLFQDRLLRHLGIKQVSAIKDDALNQENRIFTTDDRTQIHAPNFYKVCRVLLHTHWPPVTSLRRR